jgi:hypothetical protein
MPLCKNRAIIVAIFSDTYHIPYLETKVFDGKSFFANLSKIVSILSAVDRVTSRDNNILALI